MVISLEFEVWGIYKQLQDRMNVLGKNPWGCVSVQFLDLVCSY